MKIYHVTDGGLRGDSRYCGTMAEAHEYARKLDRFEVVIELIEVATDKQNVLRMLNRDGGHDGPTLRSWTLTPRGGLVPAGANMEA